VEGHVPQCLIAGGANVQILYIDQRNGQHEWLVLSAVSCQQSHPFTS